MKILIIEDSEVMREKIKELIGKSGNRFVGEAIDGEQGLIKYKELNPDLVILDMSMPNLNGIEWLEEKRKIDDKNNVLVCSAINQKVVMIEALKLGAMDYIFKPFEDHELIKKLKDIADI